MQVSMVPTGPPRQGKKGFMVAGALVASSSSTAFLAASFMAPPIAPIMLAILNRKGSERKQGENASMDITIAVRETGNKLQYWVITITV